MIRRTFLTRSGLALGALLVGDEALEAFARLTHVRKSFPSAGVPDTSWQTDPVTRYLIRGPGGIVVAESHNGGLTWRVLQPGWRVESARDPDRPTLHHLEVTKQTLDHGVEYARINMGVHPPPEVADRWYRFSVMVAS